MPVYGKANGPLVLVHAVVVVARRVVVVARRENSIELRYVANENHLLASLQRSGFLPS